MLNRKHYDFLCNYVVEKRDILVNLVNHLRSIKKEISYTGEMKIDEVFMQIIKKRPSLEDFLPVETKGDGNCFFYSISFLLNRNTDLMWSLRLGIVFILFEHKEYFSHLLETTVAEFDFNKLVEYTMRNFSWANEYIELACSILLDRPIYVYSLKHELGKAFDLMFCVSIKQYRNKPLTIGYLNNHFMALVSKTNKKPPIPTLNLYMNNTIDIKSY